MFFCQDRYSEFALTGRGDLELVGDSYKLQKETYNAFIKMQQVALREGISIQIVSSYRSYNHQKIFGIENLANLFQKD